ncbi:hypothetical protein JG687_00016846 [Phytophthora cactorum]|uniref:Uncharacterized protein n=1 Tax=Phytophthora cactorum TaxID=29920 RepID=A0A8T1TR98_9STRA|nr:hypothetical protein JG687_00016846 [Phytophthora cactorum]
MSDDVIGTVVQRTQPVRHPFYVNTGIGMHAGLGQQNYRDEPDKTPSSQIPLTRDKSSTTSRLLTMQEIHSITLVSEFLSATMAPDLDIGARSGIEALTKSWRIFAHAFPGGHIQLESLRQLTSFCLVATTRTSVTLTKQTLQYLFHRLADGSEANSKRRENIFARLLDQRIVMCGSVRFDWDDTSKRVIGLYTHVDMLSPMLTLLGNLEDVSFVFSGALITPDGDFSTKKANEPWRE